jgi:hypothetical protein
MLRLTCMDADRLAHDLRQAETYVRQAAHFHADQYAAMRIIGNRVLADYHHDEHLTAATIANDLANYTERLADRKPLWDTGIGPSDQPRPAVRLPNRNNLVAGKRR